MHGTDEPRIRLERVSKRYDDGTTAVHELLVPSAVHAYVSGWSSGSSESDPLTITLVPVDWAIVKAVPRPQSRIRNGGKLRRADTIS